MDNKVSPKYHMKLAKEVNDALWKEFNSYKETASYIEKWQTNEGGWNNVWENFPIYKKDNGEIDTISTLRAMDGDILIRIAIDLGVDTPDFIPSIPIFRNELKTSYEIASATFERAFKQCEEHPDTAIGLANSALESIIKEIFKDERLANRPKENKTLYELAAELLKDFKMFPESDLPIEIKKIGSSLLSVSQHIEKIRSEKTNMHGKTKDDYIIKDSIYAYFVINSVTTVGLFLESFYKKKYPNKVEKAKNLDDLPF